MQINTRYTLQFYWQHVWRYPGLMFLCLMGLFFGVTAQMIVSWVLKEFVDFLSVNAPGLELAHQGLVLLVSILLLELFSTAAWQVLRYGATTLQSRVMNEIAGECFYRLHLHSFRYFNNQFVGALVKRVNRMVRAFIDITDLSFFSFGPSILRTLIVLGTLFWIDLRLGGLVLLWVILFLAAQYAISVYKLKRFDIPKSEADSRVTAHLADSVTNHSTIQLFARLPFERERFREVSTDWAQKTRASWWVSSHVEGLQGLLMLSLNFVVLYFAFGLWQAGTLSVGYFVLIQSYLWELYMQLWDVGRNIRHLYENLADANEMSEVLRTPLEIVDKPRAKTLKVSRGVVEFDQVSFSYSGEEQREVLKHLSFKAKAGERIALIGPSGGGKTTIIKLLLRLFDVSRGHILVDGQDIAKVQQDSLRSQIALVPQDPILFHRSIRENIRYGRLEATDEEVEAASKLAHCHEFILHLPAGYDTFVGERGVKLSGGERQRVAIARALLANAPILILDEATSSLDGESELLIKKALKRLMKGKTVFVIAHRLSTIVDMDRIVVLEKGRIVEEGSHAELLAKGGLYQRLWSLQVGGYLE